MAIACYAYYDLAKKTNCLIKNEAVKEQLSQIESQKEASRKRKIQVLFVSKKYSLFYKRNAF